MRRKLRFVQFPILFLATIAISVADISQNRLLPSASSRSVLHATAYPELPESFDDSDVVMI